MFFFFSVYRKFSDVISVGCCLLVDLARVLVGSRFCGLLVEGGVGDGFCCLFWFLERFSRGRFGARLGGDALLGCCCCFVLCCCCGCGCGCPALFPFVANWMSGRNSCFSVKLARAMTRGGVWKNPPNLPLKMMTKEKKKWYLQIFIGKEVV